jgi:hypothetical protein
MTSLLHGKTQILFKQIEEILEEIRYIQSELEDRGLTKVKPHLVLVKGDENGREENGLL